MKLSQLVDPLFQSELNLLNGQKLPLKAAYKLKTIIAKAKEELRNYDEVRLNSLKTYGNKNEDGGLATDENGNVTLEGENAVKFQVELQELLHMNVEIPTLSISELGNDLVMSSDQLAILAFIID